MLWNDSIVKPHLMKPFLNTINHIHKIDKIPSYPVHKNPMGRYDRARQKEKCNFINNRIHYCLCTFNLDDIYFSKLITFGEPCPNVIINRSKKNDHWKFARSMKRLPHFTKEILLNIPQEWKNFSSQVQIAGPLKMISQKI